MTFCGRCGAQCAPHESFCPRCGAPVANSYPQPQPQPQPQTNYTTNNYYTAPNRESTWDGGVLDTVITSLLASLLITITCGIAAPWAICYMMRFVVDHAVIDGRRMTFDGTGGQLFGQWIKWLLLTIITLGIYSFWVIPRMYKWVASHIHCK